ncbi:MAG: hypothetical protein QM601_09610 [Pseudoxanthomonas sp.]
MSTVEGCRMGGAQRNPSFALGFLLPFTLSSGGIETVTSFVQDLPRTLTGRNHGNFGKDKLRKAYERAVAYAGDRRIDDLLVYEGYVRMTVENPSQPNAYDNVTLRGAVAESEPDRASSAISPEETFCAADTNFGMLERALDDALKHGGLKQMLYIGLRTRPGIPGVSINEQAGLTSSENRSVVITVGFDGDYGSTSRTYDGASGRFLD